MGGNRERKRRRSSGQGSASLARGEFDFCQWLVVTTALWQADVGSHVVCPSWKSKGPPPINDGAQSSLASVARDQQPLPKGTEHDFTRLKPFAWGRRRGGLRGMRNVTYAHREDPWAVAASVRLDGD